MPYDAYLDRYQALYKLVDRPIARPTTDDLTEAGPILPMILAK